MTLNKSKAFTLALFSIAACRQPPPASVIHIAEKPVTSQLVGEGRLSAAPEYIELTVAVQSECYPTPAAASAATDAAVGNIMRLLSSAIDSENERDGVFSHGGFTRSFSRYVGDRLVCRDTFQKATTVIMKSSRVKAFPGEFARIQRDILTGALRKPASPRGGEGLTFATLATPIPRLTHERRERLEQEALADAVENARAKLAATAAVACKDKRPAVINFVERSPTAGRPIPYDRSQPGTGSGATIEFDAIWINKLLEVHFEPC